MTARTAAPKEVLHENRPVTQSVSRLIETVIDGGYCIGCGACAALTGSPLAVQLDSSGRYQATLRGNSDAQELPLLEVCPFSEKAVNEDEIGRALFGERSAYHHQIGYFLNTYAGHVAESSYRDAGSSGGMGTWMLSELFARNLIDGVLHVHPVTPDEHDGLLFKYSISKSADDIKRNAKSRYYPVEMSGVLQQVRQAPGRYAVVGVPCFIKALRLLARQDPIIADRVKYTIALVCGHSKSTRFAGLFAWQNGIHPDAVTAIDFRHKLDGQPANRYAVRLRGMSAEGEIEVVRQNKEHFGFLWGHGFFKYNACDFCDDVVGETADLTVGDAWLPQFVNDSRGTNIVVARSKALRDLIEEGIGTGRLALQQISPDDVAQSQAAGFRHRRDGLAYRLYEKDRSKQWRPPKRVAARCDHLSRRQRKIFRLRALLARESHSNFSIALRQGSFETFVTLMAPLMRKYDRVVRGSIWAKAVGVAKRLRRIPANLR